MAASIKFIDENDVVKKIFNNQADPLSVSAVFVHTPHVARHAMGRHLIKKTCNLAAGKDN